jgi:catechol 2,3-dioxygenase-like lactoylglutathione lyase family enzyme
MLSRIEHANISVSDIDKAVRFITTALPEFYIRGGDKSGRGEWIHVGTDETYISFAHRPDTTPGQGLRVNHIGIVVDDIDGVISRLESAGYKQNYTPEESQWRRRYYFGDDDGLQWEFIEYLTDDPALINNYEL